MIEERFVFVPGYEDAPKGIRFTRLSEDSQLSPKGATTTLYLSSVLKLEKGTEAFETAFNAVRKLVIELNS